MTMKTVKYGLEITFPDEDVTREEIDQKLSELKLKIEKFRE